MSKHPQLNPLDTQVNFPLLMNARQLLPLPQISNTKLQINNNFSNNSISPFILPPIQNPQKFESCQTISNSETSNKLVTLPPITNYPQVKSTSLVSTAFTNVENSVSEEREAKRLKQITTSSNTHDSPRAFKKHFKLFQEPFDQQRKSYTNENRHLLPKPLIICPIVEGSSSKSEGVVSVRLVNENMKELENTKGNILKGNTIQSLDAYEKAHFLLKIMDTSEGGKFRLVFNITYQLQGNPTIYEDVVVSQPFKVTSNKKIMSEAAKATNLKPDKGYCMLENEVWIKGRSFSENKSIKVKFGELSAKVCEVEDNLLTVIAPPRTNLTENVTVPVLVMATSMDGSSMSVCENLTYTYLVNEIK